MTLPISPPINPIQDWMENAACKGMDTASFFSEFRIEQMEAKNACASCKVRRECLDYALVTNSTFGIYGGLTHRERRKLLANGYWPGRGADPFRASRVLEDTVPTRSQA